MHSNVKLVAAIGAVAVAAGVAVALVLLTFAGATSTALSAPTAAFGALPTPGAFVTAATNIRMQVAADAQQVDAATAQGYMAAGSLTPLHQAATAMAAMVTGAIGELAAMPADASQTVEKSEMIAALDTIRRATIAEAHATSPQQVLGDIQTFDAGVIALGGAPVAP